MEIEASVDYNITRNVPLYLLNYINSENNFLNIDELFAFQKDNITNLLKSGSNYNSTKLDHESLLASINNGNNNKELDQNLLNKIKEKIVVNINEAELLTIYNNLKNINKSFTDNSSFLLKEKYNFDIDNLLKNSMLKNN